MKRRRGPWQAMVWTSLQLQSHLAWVEVSDTHGDPPPLKHRQVTRHKRRHGSASVPCESRDLQRSRVWNGTAPRQPKVPPPPQRTLTHHTRNNRERTRRLGSETSFVSWIVCFRTFRTQTNKGKGSAQARIRHRTVDVIAIGSHCLAPSLFAFVMFDNLRGRGLAAFPHSCSVRWGLDGDESPSHRATSASVAQRGASIFEFCF